MGKKELRLFYLILYLLSHVFVVQSQTTVPSSVRTEMTNNLPNGTKDAVTAQSEVSTGTEPTSSNSASSIISSLVSTVSSSLTTTRRPVTTTDRYGISKLSPSGFLNSASRSISTTAFQYSSTTTEKKNAPVWSAPLISLTTVCGVLLAVCLICIIVICKLKKSLKRRSKLYTGVVDGDEHTYMDLGDQPLRSPPPVELKSVTETPKSETQLTKTDEKTGAMKPYKDRKRKPAPPLPQSAVPSAKNIKQPTVKNEKDTSVKEKRQNSVKNKPPTYNNSIPLDVSDEYEDDIYEKYDHSKVDGYNVEMIEDGLNGKKESGKSGENNTQDERQRQTSFESDSSNKLRHPQGSFIVSDDAHREGLAFTERQISSSGLPEIVVQYNANKEAASPLHLKDLQAYENTAFENETETDPETAQSALQVQHDHLKANNAQPNCQSSNTVPFYELAREISPSSISVYDDNFVPDTKSLEHENIENLPLYEDTNNNPTSAFYDDNFVPDTKSPEHENIENLPLYEDTNNNPTSAFYDDNSIPDRSESGKETVDDLPLYEDAEDLPNSISSVCDDNTATIATHSEKETVDDLPLYEDAYVDSSNQLELAPVTAFSGLNESKTKENFPNVTTQNGLPCEHDEISGDESNNINDFGVNEDYELQKLPPAPPPPIRHDLHEQDQNAGSQNIAVGLNPSVNTFDRDSLSSRIEGMMPRRKSGSNENFSSQSLASPNASDNELLNFENSLESQNITSQENTPRLLDLSLKPESKFRSGSKVDIFDEPATSPDSYFLDMNDLPSELVDNITSDASPVIDDENPISIINNDKDLLPDINSAVPTSDTNSLAMTIKVQSESPIKGLHNRVLQNAEGKAVVNLLDFESEDQNQLAGLRGESSISSMQPFRIEQYGEVENISQLVDIENLIDDDSDIYDTPPPNFPPPVLKR